MKDQEISTLELDIGIRKVILKTSKEASRTQLSQYECLDSSLASEDLPVGLKFPSRRYKTLLGYLTILHYYPCEKSIYVYLYMDLLEHLEKSESFWLSALVEDKELFLRYLVEQQSMTLQQFYAGICNVKKLVTLIDSIIFQFEEKFKTPRRILRRKGYRDKGSHGSSSSRTLNEGIKNDFYLSLYLHELEEKQLIRSEKTQLLKLHLLEGRVLTDELYFEFKLKPGRRTKNGSERNFTAEDYCKRRANEENLRKEREARRAAEKARIETYQSKICTYKLGEEPRGKI